MNRFKARRVESRDLGLCTYSGCTAKYAPGRVLCKLHLKKEAQRNARRRNAAKYGPFAPFVWVG